MSNDFKVPYTTIRTIGPHPTADRLDIATIYGFQVITQKGKYKVGDPIIYVPIDSLLPQELEDRLFPSDSKIRLNNHRIRQIRIRGLASQGMIIDPYEVMAITCLEDIELEKDISGELGITKYEPPVRGSNMQAGSTRNRNKAADHPLFHKYNGLDSIKWFPDLFKEGEWVHIQEKLHGTNARASILPYNASNPWKKLLVRLNLAPKYENHYGSNNVQISGKVQGWLACIAQKIGLRQGVYIGFYGADIYGAAFRKCDAFSKLQPGEIVFGEIIGPGIQKGYEYGLTEHKFILFDVKVLQPDGSFQWLSPGAVTKYVEDRNFEMVPRLYFGPYGKEDAYKLTFGPSAYCPTEKVREGIVIKTSEGYDQSGNKRALKWVSEIYLDNNKNTDNH